MYMVSKSITTTAEEIFNSATNFVPRRYTTVAFQNQGAQTVLLGDSATNLLWQVAPGLELYIDVSEPAAIFAKTSTGTATLIVWAWEGKVLDP